MWGKVLKRCSACAERGRQGPWCIADRPCYFPTTPSRSHSNASTPDITSASRLLSAPASVNLNIDSSFSESDGQWKPPSVKVAAQYRAPSAKPSNVPPRPPNSPPESRRRSEPLQNSRGKSEVMGARRNTSRASQMSQRSSLIKPASPSGSADGRRKQAAAAAESEDADMERDLNALQSMVTRQAESWRQVELTIEKLCRLASAEERFDTEHHLQKLTNGSKLHSMQTKEVLGRIIERVQMRREFSSGDFPPDTRALAEARAAITRQQTEVEKDRANMEKEKAAAIDAVAFVRAECDRKVEDEKAQSALELRKNTEECERKIAQGQLEMSRKTGEFFADCGRTMEANKAEMVRQMADFRMERERMETEKADVLRKMADFRAESEKKMAEEEAESTRIMKNLRAECERKVMEEKISTDTQLAEGRHQIEEQLRSERNVTDRIMTVLQELPPLQTAMELGDLGLLEQELKKWKSSELPERFGNCKGVVEAVLKLAEERLHVWRGVERIWKDILKETELRPSSTVSALRQQSQKIFRVLKESQLTKMDLRRSDRQAMERVYELLLAWQERAMSHSNTVQRMIVRKVATWPNLGLFDFADLDICLRLVDRKESTSEAFLSRARALVEDENLAPHELRPLLTHLEAMLFYLKYTGSEDLSLAHTEFKKQAKELDPAVLEYLNWAERMYPPGSELVHLSPGMDLMDEKNVTHVLNDLRKTPSVWRRDSLGPFREIFYQWAVAMHNTFNLLVLPHHTQVICLLAFQRFLESKGGPHTIIAQVGTGEGKSMIIATLAIYIAVILRMKVHVVIDDETLLERDFAAFKRVFDAFEVEVPGAAAGSMRPLSAIMCVSEERLAGATSSGPHMAARIDPNADVVYCEAKHVQSYYASIARGTDPDFDTYKRRVLILDEVDALVVDEEPNDIFVYPNDELSQLATSVAELLARGLSEQEIHAKIMPKSEHPAAARVISEMSKEWAHGKRMISGSDFAFVKETNRYAGVHAGRVNPKSWSLALECRNYQDGLCKEVLFQERLFVTSRPRVYKKYHRVLGLSGSIGNKPEQAFLQGTYQASFFKVPPFLKTCKGSPFHEASPVRIGQDRRITYVEVSDAAQVTRVAELALDARERVPVLIIAKDRQFAEHLVECLRNAARSRGLGARSEDVVRSLSRVLYESDPEQWKENLYRATLPCGDGGEKCWRVTVTDPRGGRGTDYRVDDTGVDAEGGLLLIPTIVPTSRRDWTQFLGRTARQDCRGQFCCVLSSTDYETLGKKYKEVLQVDGGLGVVETVLNWGDRESAERIQKCAALFNTGLRMNELCEVVFGKRRDIFKDRQSREILVDACQRLRFMSVKEVSEAFNRLPSFSAAAIATEATDLGRPAEPPKGSAGFAAGTVQLSGFGKSSEAAPPKVIVFCLDWSASMMSRDTGTAKNRFETCVACVQNILQNQLRDCDFVSVVGFGPNVQVVAPPTQKGQGGPMLATRLAGLRPQVAGGTRFFDAMEHCLQLLKQPGGSAAAGTEKWLVCLTDGDDAGSQRGNSNGELITRMLSSSMPADLNMLIITVGAMKASNMQIIGSWTERVSAAGGVGRLLAEKEAASIGKAFDVVAECLAVDVGGVIEC